MSCLFEIYFHLYNNSVNFILNSVGGESGDPFWSQEVSIFWFKNRMFFPLTYCSYFSCTNNLV